MDPALQIALQTAGSHVSEMTEMCIKLFFYLKLQLPAAEPWYTVFLRVLNLTHSCPPGNLFGKSFLDEGYIARMHRMKEEEPLINLFIYLYLMRKCIGGAYAEAYAGGMQNKVRK